MSIVCAEPPAAPAVIHPPAADLLLRSSSPVSNVIEPALSQGLPETWSADDEVLRCVAVQVESPDVRTFVLRPLTPRSFRYRPGQFMTLAIQMDGQTQRRCYTLSSSPTRPDTVSITVKRVPGGLVSNWLHDHVVPGMSLDVMGPAGQFSCFDVHGQAPVGLRPLLFISGGSGITPLMSMSRALADLSLDLDVQFLHAARSPRDALFQAELGLFSRQLPRFRHSLLCEQRGDQADYAGLLGRLSAPMLQSLVPDVLTRDVYCCGPAPFMAAVRQILRDLAFDLSHYREESFAFEEAPPAAERVAAPAPVVASPSPTQSAALGSTPPTVEISPAPGASGPLADDPPAAGASDPAVSTFQVQLHKRGDAFTCRGDQTILQAAKEAGLRLPHSCSNGVCGTCRTQKVTGTVDMTQGGGLRPREVAQGWILPCCSKPLSDLVLDR